MAIFFCTLILLWLYNDEGLCTETDNFSSNEEDRAFINVTWQERGSSKLSFKVDESGIFAKNGKIASDHGILVHVKNGNKSDGCTPPENAPSERWIALIERGECRFHVKIHNAAKVMNASAVIIYNNGPEEDLDGTSKGSIIMDHDVKDVVSVFVERRYGLWMKNILANDSNVMVYISKGKHGRWPPTNINKTSVLFVSISFIVLMIISLAWLVFYYVQRFRYAHAKERLSRRLANAAKKAITRIPLRTVKNGDKETTVDFDPCAVCIEGYKISDVVRVLPCKHVFHKSCVDPWLLEQRSCPMCKMDILRAYGFHVNGSHESVRNNSGGHITEVEADAEAAANTHETPDVTVPILINDDNNDSDTNVEVLHLQPPDIECHNKRDHTRDSDSEQPGSTRSSESECNEMQSLMSSPDGQQTTVLDV